MDVRQRILQREERGAKKMKNSEEKSGLYKNEIEFEELEKAIFLKSFPWEVKIKTLMNFTKKLEHAGIKYTILTSYKLKCKNIYISKEDKARIPFDLKIELKMF